MYFLYANKDAIVFFSKCLKWLLFGYCDVGVFINCGNVTVFIDSVWGQNLNAQVSADMPRAIVPLRPKICDHSGLYTCGNLNLFIRSFKILVVLFCCFESCSIYSRKCIAEPFYLSEKHIQKGVVTRKRRIICLY